MGYVEKVRLARKRGLCLNCLGRLFGRVGHGLDNLDRGKALTAMVERKGDGPTSREELEALLARGDELDIGDVRLEDCGLCEGLFFEVPKFAKMASETMEPWEFGTFLVGTKIDPEIVAREEDLWAELGLEDFEPLKTALNREIGKLLEGMIGKPVDFERPDIVALIDTRYDHVELTIASIFIYGRYHKLERGIPQTRWPCKKCWGKGCKHCDGKGKMYGTSVEEIVAKWVMDEAGGESEAFHGMGREDIDARMLGNGRPFILEIKKPRKRTLDLEKMMETINHGAKGRVVVSDMRPSEHDEVAVVKNARPSKTYRALVACEEPITDGKLNEVVTIFMGRSVTQRTPERVSHRRADLDRVRKVLDIQGKALGEREFTLEITGEAGIYIKELVHGDGGRTRPSIAEVIGSPCEVKELDVIAIHDQE